MVLSKADEMLLSAETAEETKKALEMGANVNAKDEQGKTALMYAKTAKQTKLLLEAGADVNAKDWNWTGKTALMYAKTAEQTKLLLEAGADVNVVYRWRMSDKETALSYAHTVDQAIVLLKNGANIEDLNNSKQLSLEEKFEIINILKKDTEIQVQIAKNKERLKNGPKLKGKSGVVIAGEIAKRQISGEEKRVITPEVGKELRQEIMKEMNNKKGQRE